MQTNWSALRELVAREPGTINLNAGTLSPTPLRVLERVTELRRRQASNPSDFVWRQAPPMIGAAREALAAYLNCPAAELLLLPNITFGMNVVVASIAPQLPAGAEVLTTDHEYGAMIHCWRRAAEERAWAITRLPLPHLAEDAGEIVEAFARRITPATRVLFFSHVNASTGLVMPAVELAQLARQRGLICVIDGAHAPGMVPVDLAAIGADYYAANCHKWMMAPAVCGFLHVARERRARTRPIVTSWGWGYDPAAADEPCDGGGGTRWQWAHEFHGTADRTPQMVLPDVLRFRREELGGEDAIRGRCRELVEHARRVMTARGLTCATPRASSHAGGALIAFDVPPCDPVNLRNWLWHTHKIECPVTVGGDAERTPPRHFLRLSCAWFNSAEEIDRLAEVVTQMPVNRGA